MKRYESEILSGRMAFKLAGTFQPSAFFSPARDFTSETAGKVKSQP
jgi:hypothetical protein